MTFVSALEDFDLSTAGKALDAARHAVSPVYGEPKSSFFDNLQYHLARAVGFGFIASVWGKLRWSVVGLTSGLSLTKTSKHLKAKSRCGLAVFTLLSMDILTEAAMLWPAEGVSLKKHLPEQLQSSKYLNKTFRAPESILGYPITTAAPVIESGLLSAIGLLFLRFEKYIVFPMALASAHAHSETVSDTYFQFQQYLPKSIGGVGKEWDFDFKKYLYAVRKFILPSIPFLTPDPPTPLPEADKEKGSDDQ